jgi:hypothetical protein
VNLVRHTCLLRDRVTILNITADKNKYIVALKEHLGQIMDYEVENVARAFYYAEEDLQVWENEAEILKEEFRLYARLAISALKDKEQELDEVLEAAGTPSEAEPSPSFEVRELHGA